MNYVQSRLKQRQEDFVFKIYVTDSLRGLYKAHGGEVNSRYYDLITKRQIVEKRAPEEIIEGIKNKLKNNSEV